MEFENLTPIQTNFGIIYIEPFNPAEREEEERIKVYDTLGKYIDYCSAENFENEEEFEELCEFYKKAKALKNIFPDNITFATKSWKEMYIYLLVNDYLYEEEKQKISRALLKEDLTDDFLISHDFINVVGEFYILVSEL